MQSNKNDVDEVRELAELFWAFHNARLTDPSINDMTPYIQPVLAWHQSQLNQLKEELLSSMPTFKDLPQYEHDAGLKWEGYSDGVIAATKAINNVFETSGMPHGNVGHIGLSCQDCKSEEGKPNDAHMQYFREGYKKGYIDGQLKSELNDI